MIKYILEKEIIKYGIVPFILTIIVVLIILGLTIFLVKKELGGKK